MNTPIVAPTLDYLRGLQAAGHRLADIEVAMLKPGLYRACVYTEIGECFEFHVEADRSAFDTHHREAVQFTGFGARGLSNLIYTDACAKSNESRVPKNRIQILLSGQCFQRIQNSLPQWMHYGFTFQIRPSLFDISYIVEIVPE